ncbi:MAG: hypothetical protein NZ455_02575 [Bacteroidia bacterium]|nr:hypothetical protein [Bacteroidia bacterium]MDW8348022.1 hypothetical protein [Bacteroidia bacterium]
MRRVREQCAAQAKHRSDSVARSTPTRAQRRDTPKNQSSQNLTHNNKTNSNT